MNAWLAQQRVAAGWPELVSPAFDSSALAVIFRDVAEAEMSDAVETAHAEGYEKAEDEYKPDADACGAAEEQRDEAVARADDLQAALDAAVEGDVSALWAAKLNALRSEVLWHLDNAGAYLEPERKAAGRRTHLRALRQNILAAFAAATPNK